MGIYMYLSIDDCVAISSLMYFLDLKILRKLNDKFGKHKLYIYYLRRPRGTGYIYVDKTNNDIVGLMYYINTASAPQCGQAGHIYFLDRYKDILLNMLGVTAEKQLTIASIFSSGGEIRHFIKEWPDEKIRGLINEELQYIEKRSKIYDVIELD